MRVRHVLPFVLLFAWQTTPPDSVRERFSPLRLWLGIGTSSFETGTATDCRGRPFTVSESNDVLGAQVDAWTSPTMRLSGAVGQDRRSGFGLGLAAWEAQGVGVGLGWAEGEERFGYRGPSAYLRLGRADGGHLRAELRPPTPMPGVTGWAHVGVAYRRGRLPGASVYVGVAAVKVASGDTQAGGVVTATKTGPALFADFSFGLCRWLDLFAQLHAADKAGGLGLGVRSR